MLRRTMARAYFRAIGWTVQGAPPDPDHIGILIAAPHTSGHDFPLMLATAWRHDLHPRYLAKKELFSGPWAPLYRLTGGIPTDRKQPGTLVADLVERAGSGESFMLVIAPEGTRKSGDGWRSGFYRIAHEAQIPITLCSVDSASKQVWFGPTFLLTGDVSADMDRVRAFYADKGGVVPERKSPVRLAMEDGQEGTSAA